MGLLTNIINTVKRNTLDKTSIDENIGKAFNTALRTGQNFFTQQLPQQYKQNVVRFDNYMRNDPKLFQLLPKSQPLLQNPTAGNFANRLVVQPSAKILDKALETAYRISGDTWAPTFQALNRRQVPSIPPTVKYTTNDLLNVAAPLKVAAVVPNVIGGGIGTAFQAVDNVMNKRPIQKDLDEAYDEGYAFSTKLGTLGKMTSKITPLLEKSPVIKNVIAKLRPEEVTGFKSWLSSSLKAGNKAGIDMAIYGATQDAENGAERLQNMWREYQMGAVFGGVTHGAQKIIPGVVKPTVKKVKEVVDIYNKIPNKESGSLDLDAFFKKKLADIEQRKAEYAKENYTPFSVGELQRQFVKNKAVSLPKTTDPKDAPIVGRILDAMQNASSSKFNRQKMENALIRRFKSASTAEKQSMLETANFDRTSIADYVKQHKIGGYKSFWKQQQEDADRTLINVEPPIERVKQPFLKKPVVEPQTVQKPVVAPVKPAADIPTIGKKAETIKTKEEYSSVIDDINAFRRNINESLKKKNSSYSELVDQMESGTIAPQLQDEAQKIKAFYDTFAEVGRRRRSVFPGTLEKYHHRISEKRYEELAPKDFGTSIIDADYAKHRTGKLTEYIKDDRALDAYAREAIGSADPQRLAEQKLANQIIAEVQHKTAESPKAKPKLSEVVSEPNVDYVSKVKEAGLTSDAPVVYIPKAKEGMFSRIFRSVDDRVARYGDDAFYNAFLDPFKKSQIEIEQIWSHLNKLDDQSLIKQYQTVTGSKSANVDRLTMLTALFKQNSKATRAHAVNTYLQNVKNSSIDNPELKQLVNDIGDEYITRDLVQKGFLNKFMGQIRAQTGRGALGLNVTSAINNIFELKRVASSVSTKNLSTAVKRWLNGERVHLKYGIDSKTTTALERGRKRFKILEKIDNTLFYLFDKTETTKDDLMLLAFEEQAMSKGLKGDALRQYVQKKFSQYAIKYGKGQDIGLYRNDLIKTLGQFGQYAIKDVVLAGDKMQGAFKGDIGDRKYLAKFAVISALQMMALSKILGTIGFGGETGTPLDFVKKTLTKGNLQSPIVSLGILLTQEAFAPEDEDDFTKTQRRESIARTLGVMTIPASNQLIFKTGKQALNQQRGYYETQGGNVANETGKDIRNVVTSLAFGPSYDSKRQQYIKDYKAGKQPALNKTESEVYRNLPEEERTNFYNTRIAKEQREQNINKALKENEEEPNLLERIFNVKKKKENVFLTPLTTSSLPEEIKEYNKAFDLKLDSGLDVTDEEIQSRYFRVNKTDSKDISEREKAFAQIKTLQDRDDLPDSFKEQVLQVSNVKKDDWEYYTKAKQNVRERRQEIISIAERTTDREAMLQTFLSLRKSVAGSKVLTNEDVDYLYDNGYISEDEKKFINALKYDEVKEQFYFDRDYQSGGSGSKASQKAAMNKLLSMFKALYKEFDGKKGNSQEAKKLLKLLDIPANTANNRIQTLLKTRKSKISDAPNVKIQQPSSKLLNKYLNK